MNSSTHEQGPDQASCTAADPARQQSGPATPARKTIFVKIAAYRDSECLPTISDLFQKAARPENVSVGVCWQFLPDLDPENLDLSSFPNRVRVFGVDARMSRGVCWARHEAEQFYDGEDYVLQSDSHSRFVANWDDLMCAELARCNASKAALTCNPPPYYPPNSLEPNPRPIVKRAAPFNDRGDMRCCPEYLDVFPDAPVQTAFVSSGFVFATGELLRDVATDPWLYYDQEEIAYSVRLFTHGWNVYCPSQVLLYRHYHDGSQSKCSRPLHWQDCPNWGSYQKIGLARFNHLTQFSGSSDPDVLVDLEKYSLGTARTLDEFQRFSGIDFRNKTVTDHGLQLRFVPGIDRLRKSRVRLASQARSTNNEGRAPDRCYRFTTTDWKLEAGDVVPFFSLPGIHGGKLREIQHFAGKPIVLFFVGNPAHPDVPRFRQLVKPLSEDLGEAAWSICIIRAALRDQFQGKVCSGVWVDRHSSIAKSFGFDPDSEPASLGGWAVLTPNLKVAALAPFGQLDAAMERIRAALELLKRDPGKKVQTAHPPVLLVDDVLPPGCCQSLIQYWSTGKRYDGRVGGQVYDPTSKVRTDCILYGTASAEVDQLLARKLLPEIHKVFNIKITRREPYKVGMYSAEKGGFFRPHRDNFEPRMIYRRLAVSINLNNGFEGGGVIFPEYANDTYCAAPGSALVFPCTLVHGVTPVTRGERFMMVGFLYSEEEHQRRKRCQDPTLYYDDRLLTEW
jgi:predicted 2-oxoglutarate/Fe(II)-dependent dioxygenase YbiX